MRLYCRHSRIYVLGTIVKPIDVDCAVRTNMNSSAIAGNIAKTLTIKVPGSTSNIGPGFDALAIALAIYSRLTFTLLEQDDPSIPSITFEGAVKNSSLQSDV